jgi:hypothetical protein
VRLMAVRGTLLLALATLMLSSGCALLVVGAAAGAGAGTAAVLMSQDHRQASSDKPAAGDSKRTDHKPLQEQSID